jgi:hypothetical protein
VRGWRECWWGSRRCCSEIARRSRWSWPEEERRRCSTEVRRVWLGCLVWKIGASIEVAIAHCFYGVILELSCRT